MTNHVKTRSGSVPTARISVLRDREPDSQSEFVLYWMVASRRVTWNFGLQRAVDWAVELNKPLVVFEPLRAGYRWASDRLHHFVLQGMAANQQRLAKHSVFYYPYLECEAGQGKGLLDKLAGRSAVIVSDDFPAFFLPRMMSAVAQRLSVRFELVDSNGIYPMRSADKAFARAHDFRRHLQKSLQPHLDEFPQADPLNGVKLPVLDDVPYGCRTQWPAAEPTELANNPDSLCSFNIDHSVPVVMQTPGGTAAAERTLRQFLDNRLDRYGDDRNHPDEDAASHLSPYLHFGHLSAHQVFHQVMQRAGWRFSDIAPKATGSREGWWNAGEATEAFLDELITWREVGFNMCAHRDDYDQYESLPDWARQTLADHEQDRRDEVYTLEEFEAAQTHDPIWNAAQRQLLRDGIIHNYLRMLWGKKILHWTRRAQDALEIMIELNNKYALDGRDPNSYSGIFWVLGRYDRAWGPERPIFGKIRYMTSDSTQRKLKLSGYLEEYGE